MFAVLLRGGSSVGIHETNVHDKSLAAGVNDQLLMSFTVEPWESIPGDIKFTTIDLHCTPGTGFSNLTLKTGEELATTQFILEEGKMKAHFDEIDFSIPNGVATEFEFLVDVKENTGDFITACALDNLQFLNLESGTQYESDHYVFDFDIDTLVYVNDSLVANNSETGVNVLAQVVYDDVLGLSSQDNKLLEFKLNASEEVELNNLFIYCSNASELKKLSLRADGVEMEPTAVHVDWLTTSRPEHSGDKRIVFADLALKVSSEAKIFELYGDTYNYFSNLTGPTCKLMDTVARDLSPSANPVPTQETTKTYSDVSVANKYSESINYLTEKRVFEGYADGTFKPLNLLNRAELIKTLVTGKGVQPTLEEGYEFCFPDVSQQWFAPYICYAKEQKWIEGYPDGNFYPANDVIKVEAIKMLVNSQGYPLVPVYGAESLFNDVDKKQWYARYVKAAKERGLLEETEVYGVDEKIKREQVSENIYRAMFIAEKGLSYYSNPKKGALNYNHSELGINFDYPYDWEVSAENNGKVSLISPKRYNMNYRLQVMIPAESFAKYEALFQGEIEGGFISVKEMKMIFGDQSYLTKEYSQHEGLAYLVKVGGEYVVITTEGYFDEQQKEEIGVILNSLSWK